MRRAEFVYAQNAADLGERAKARFEARLKTPAGTNIESLVRPFDDPVPADLRDLDLITFLFFYHDTTYMTVDRAAMSKKLYAALKPGGMLVIADHSARAGDGTSVGKTFHRIEEAALRREIEAAGTSSSSAKAISGATPMTPATSPSNRRRAGRWTNSCSSSRSRCEAPDARRNRVSGAPNCCKAARGGGADPGHMDGRRAPHIEIRRRAPGRSDAE